jgi:RNA recognition motif-containing protein
LQEEIKTELKRIKKEKEMEMLTMREERKLFIGGLSPDTVEKDLRKHFTQFGQVIDAQVRL